MDSYAIIFQLERSMATNEYEAASAGNEKAWKVEKPEGSTRLSQNDAWRILFPPVLHLQSGVGDPPVDAFRYAVHVSTLSK